MKSKIIFATSTKADGNMSAMFGLGNAIQNREKFIRSIGLDPEGLITLKQIHGNMVVQVDRSSIGLSKTNTQVADGDAMITDDPSLVLAIFTADCLPIFFYDQISKSFGIAHAGRKGTISGIAERTIKALIKNFNAKIENINVAFGPAILNCHYDQQLPQDKNKINKFKALFPKAVKRINDNYFFDLIKANITLLLESGVKKENIDLSQCQCTVCNPKLYWSYHKAQKIEGVIMSIIGTRRQQNDQ